ncbi:competence protein ComK, partial [Anaerorhabdus sp.]
MLENCSCVYYDEKTNETVLLNEKSEILRIKEKPIKLFERACLENGSTLEGRLSNFRYELNVKQKP